MVRKFLHIMTDAVFIGAIVVAGWMIYPAAGVALAGVGGLLLHYAVSSGDYEDLE